MKMSMKQSADISTTLTRLVWKIFLSIPLPPLHPLTESISFCFSVHLAQWLAFPSRSEFTGEKTIPVAVFTDYSSTQAEIPGSIGS